MAEGARAFQASVVLRVVAIAIAIAGAIDPAVALPGVSRARVAVVAPEPASRAATDVRDRLTHSLSSSYEVAPQVTSDAAAVVVIGDQYPEEPVGPDLGVAGLRDALLVATVTTSDHATSGVRIVRIDAPREVPNATLIRLGVEIDAAGIEGQTTDVIAEMAGLEVGRASHRWAASEKRWRAGIDAVPVGQPPYVVRIATTVRPKPDTTGATTTHATTTDATAGTSVVSGFSRTVSDVVVDARIAPFRVEFYDPRPSWATTFLRRALEADARFDVATLSFTSRGISAETGGAVPLGDQRLDAFEVVVIGGLERLTTADARGVKRFMRERGGAVVIVPDQRLDVGPARDLVAGGAPLLGRVRLQPPLDVARGGPERVEGPDLVERLLEQPAKLAVTAPAASLQVSEMLVLSAPAHGADVIARIPGADASPVIVSMPRGDGRLLFSGALDAWRFRAADAGAFDRFWQSTVAGLAMAVPPPISIDVEPPLLRPGEVGEAIVRVRSRDVTAVSASLDGDPVRLRPEPEAGVYRGRFTARAAAGRSIVSVRVEGAQSSSASRTLLVRPDVRRLPSPPGPSLSLLSSSHRGIDVTPAHIADLERFLRGAVAAPREQQIRHPMRSTWWIAPFALCLSAEWWMRRRRGRR